MAQYLPIFAMLVLAIVFGGCSRVASRLLGPATRRWPRSAPYECGIIPEPRAAAALPGEVLPGGDDLHRLRHRDHLPVPVGGGVPLARCPSGCSPSSIFAAAVFESFVYLIATARSTGARQAAAAGSTWSTRPAPGHHHPPRRARGPRPGRRAAHERGGLMGRARWLPGQGPRGPRAQLPDRHARGAGQVGPGPQRDAGHLRPGLLRHRDDGHRRRRTTTWPATAWRSSGPRRARPTS